MLRPRSGLVHLAVLLALLASACTDASQQADEEPTATSSTSSSTTQAPRAPTLRLAVIVNESAPTAAADSELESILSEAVEILAPRNSVEVELRTVSVEAVGQAEGAMAALINDGVNVVITGCDDATVPSVIEAAVASELLTVTGCVSLPRPDISGTIANINTDLFLDLSNLADNAPAILAHASSQGFENLAVVRSNLIPDVEQTCLDVAASSSDVSVATDVTFTELIDAPADVAEVLRGALPGDVEVGAIVVCALPPAIGDITIALREAGLDQQVIAPWYADSQTWVDGAGDVAIITPASRYGDDPVDATTELFAAVGETEFVPVAIDVVTADVLAILLDAAERADSVGSQRIADAVRNSEPNLVVDGISGPVSLDGPNDSPVLRSYRVLSLDDDGTPFFSGEISSFDS